MKLLLACGILLLIAISLVLDYLWRRWIAARKQDSQWPGKNE